MQFSTLATLAFAAGSVAAAPNMQKRCDGGQATYYQAGL